MAFTYPAPEGADDATVALCDVRLNITDTDDEKPLLQDHEIAAFLRMARNGVFLASALALEHIANKTALLLKRIKTLELETDGPATAKDLRAQAATYRQHQKDEAAAEDAQEGAFFEVVPMRGDIFSCREIY